MHEEREIFEWFSAEALDWRGFICSTLDGVLKNIENQQLNAEMSMEE